MSGAFGRTMIRQLSWMLAFGFPLVGLVHIAMGSFLSLQAYYGSTFVDGTGAVVGVGLLRNLGGLMTGMILSGILAARMIPELRQLVLDLGAGPGEPGGRVENRPPVSVGSLAAPRIVAAAIACTFLSMWGIFVGTVVGWQASVVDDGPAHRDVLPDDGADGLASRRRRPDRQGTALRRPAGGHLLPRGVSRGRDESVRAGPGIVPLYADAGAPLAIPVLRAACLGIVAILIVNASWFMLVYHAVPFYGPTLLKPPGL